MNRYAALLVAGLAAGCAQPGGNQTAPQAPVLKQGTQPTESPFVEFTADVKNPSDLPDKVTFRMRRTTSILGMVLFDRLRKPGFGAAVAVQKTNQVPTLSDGYSGDISGFASTFQQSLEQPLAGFVAKEGSPKAPYLTTFAEPDPSNPTKVNSSGAFALACDVLQVPNEPNLENPKVPKHRRTYKGDCDILAISPYLRRQVAIGDVESKARELGSDLSSAVGNFFKGLGLGN